MILPSTSLVVRVLSLSLSVHKLHLADMSLVSNNPYVYNPFAPGASYTNDLLGLHNGPFRGPDTAMSDYSYVPHLPVAINPDWLQSNKSPQHDVG